MKTIKKLLIVLISITIISCNSKSTSNEKLSDEETKTIIEEPKEEPIKEIPTVTSFKLFKDYFEDPSICKVDYDNKEFIVTDLVVMYVSDIKNKRCITTSTYRKDDVFDGVTRPEPDGWGFKYVKIDNKPYRLYRGDMSSITVELKDPHQIDQTSLPKVENVSLNNDNIQVYNDLKVIKVKGKIQVRNRGCFIEKSEIID